VAPETRVGEHPGALRCVLHRYLDLRVSRFLVDKVVGRMAAVGTYLGRELVCALQHQREGDGSPAGRNLLDTITHS
jgi:hypothetical protein